MNKTDITKTAATTWAPARGLDVHITITLKDATRWQAEQRRKAA
jgi:hypothetical protein